MFDTNILCPHCKKVLGRVDTTDEERTIVKTLKSPPKTQIAKSHSVQCKCHGCGKKSYFVLAFEG